MSANKVRYPGPGCLVEFLQGNNPMQAVVLEEQSGRLRLYGINHRESSLPASRLLPWSGPMLQRGGVALNRAEMDAALEERRALRQSIAANISALEVWELTQGEVGKTSAEWLAGLVWKTPDIDHEAALGHALLAAKTHFRFSPPDFEIFPEQLVEQRLQEAEQARVREGFAVTGAQFFQKLWDISGRKRGLLEAGEEPGQELASKLKEMLLERIANPESQTELATWKLLIKGLPESPQLPLSLALAWGLVPEHYNFGLDRVGYERGEAWAARFTEEARHILAEREKLLAGLARDDSPFISVDPATTRDRDDAFFVEQSQDNSYLVRIALACPACAWPFDSELDKAVQKRACSLYLPEGDEYMLPSALGRDLFSLDAGEARPALTLAVRISPEGKVLEAEPGLRVVTVADNLDLESCERAIIGEPLPHAPMLEKALTLARMLQSRRIADGAVITERPDPEIRLQGEGASLEVQILDGPKAPHAHLLVGEFMILANSVLASWAMQRSIPLIFRTQDVALPREFSGIWTEPHDITRVVRALPPASLEALPRRHAGLGVSAYTSITSPLRRYTDLLNQGQALRFLQGGAPRLDAAGIQALLPTLSAFVEAVSQVQRQRPRYWKLLFFRQQGDKQWWNAVVTEENENFVTAALPWAQLLVRGRRRLFDEKIYPGMPVQVRLGKVSPLLQEIQVLEAREG